MPPPGAAEGGTLCSGGIITNSQKSIHSLPGSVRVIESSGLRHTPILGYCSRSLCVIRSTGGVSSLLIASAFHVTSTLAGSRLPTELLMTGSSCRGAVGPAGPIGQARTSALGVGVLVAKSLLAVGDESRE